MVAAAAMLGPLNTQRGSRFTCVSAKPGPSGRTVATICRRLSEGWSRQAMQAEARGGTIDDIAFLRQIDAHSLPP